MGAPKLLPASFPELSTFVRGVVAIVWYWLPICKRNEPVPRSARSGALGLTVSANVSTALFTPVAALNVYVTRLGVIAAPSSFVVAVPLVSINWK